MRAVASYRVLFVAFRTGSAYIHAVVGHGLVEGGVEDEDLRDARESVGDALDAHEVSAGVKGREVADTVSSFSMTSGVTLTDSEKNAPPWTILCPTASISSIDLMQPWSADVRVSMRILVATEWFGMGSSAT